MINDDNQIQRAGDTGAVYFTFGETFVNFRKSAALLLPLLIGSFCAPLAAAPIDLSQLCGPGDCVISANTTIGSASSPLAVSGNFTINPGVVLEYIIPIRIDISGNMVVSGTLGAPGNGGNGGNGGAVGQPGGAGGNAPAVVNGIFNAQGSITLNSTAVAVADGGAGGSGGLPGSGSLIGGAGGAGGTAGSLTFNTCSAFSSLASSQIQANGGPGGIGQSGAVGGAGGTGGSVTINALQTIVSQALTSVLGGTGGTGGAGAGSVGSSGSITMSALGSITVGSGTLTSGTSTPSVNPSQSTIAALSFCTTPSAGSVPGIPTLSEWALILLASLMAMFSIHKLNRRSISSSHQKTGK